MKGFGEQCNLKISHHIGTNRGKELGIDHISGTQIPYFQPSIKNIEQYQKDPVHCHHQPMAAPVIGTFHPLVIKMNPDIPKSRCLQRKDHHTE